MTLGDSSPSGSLHTAAEPPPEVELARLRKTVSALTEALERISSNAHAWHGPLVGTGHERALAVIASWSYDALARLRAEPQDEGLEAGGHKAAVVEEGRGV